MLQVRQRRVENLIQELREMGWAGSLYRARREVLFRTGAAARLASRLPDAERLLVDGDPSAASIARVTALPIADPSEVRSALGTIVTPESRARLVACADDAVAGRILCFGRWVGDFGSPIDWYLNPLERCRWSPNVHWSRSLREEVRCGDVKLAWEPARFPQAYHLARAAAFAPERAETYFEALSQQIQSFLSNTPYPYGIHWASAQEAVIRLLAWSFALAVFARLGVRNETLDRAVARRAAESLAYVQTEIEYSRRNVYNNHLLFELIALFAAPWWFPENNVAKGWSLAAREELDAECERQFYADGAYIQLSHNYHRMAVQGLLWATMIARAIGEEPSPAWLRAIERSLEFLFQHQNPADGRLPNYGANDGTMPFVTSTCDFADFRPVLQAAHVLTRGERLYPPGAWDEPATWLLGAEALDKPVRNATRRSISFAESGFHVLRSHREDTFAAFRCGTIRDRFSQIDMLHVDLWWRGLNVLADPGSYLYNGPQHWHEHFNGTAAHNTVTIDGEDQMRHHRRFKNLFWTEARRLSFESGDREAIVAGEHYGYQRQPGRCVHRRAVTLVEPDTFVVVDRIEGEFDPRLLRLHWLFDLREGLEVEANCAKVRLPVGEFAMRVFDGVGGSIPLESISAATEPPRGWLSRYYGERVGAFSVTAQLTRTPPFEFVTILGSAADRVRVSDGRVTIEGDRETHNVLLREGLPEVHGR